MARASKARGQRKQPLYQRTAEALREILEASEPGTYLPSEPKLAAQLGVSRATLREAMRTFEERGLIVRRQGIGTYVTRPPHVIETGIEALESIETLAARMGLSVEMGELAVTERAPQAAEKERFTLGVDAPVIQVSRVILAEGRPVAFLIDVVPPRTLPPEALNGQFRGSVLDLLLKRGHPRLAHSQADITAVSAASDVARALRIQRGDVLLQMEAWLYSVDGEAVDHSYSYFLPGTFRFHIVRRVASLSVR